jgi:solute carrier family 44 (choline transporter-like protein), member 2/4/5
MGKMTIQKAKVESENRYEFQNYQKQRKSNSDFDYQSLKRKHHCTDVICSILLLLFIIMLIVVSIFAYNNGNPSDLILPHDSQGRICGRSQEVKDKKYLFYFDLTRCISLTSLVVGCPTPQICVEKCPDRIAYEKIPGQAEFLNEYCDKLNEKNGCPSYILKSKPIFGRCVPSIITDISNAAENILFENQTIQVPINGIYTNLTEGLIQDGAKYIRNLVNLKKIFELAYEDFSKSVWFILLALGLGAVVSFLWLFLLRFFIKPIVYLSIFAVMALLAFGIYFCLSEYLELTNKKVTDNDIKLEFEKLYDLNYMSSLKTTWLVFTIILAVVFIVLLLILIFLRKRIAFAVALIKEVSKALVALPLTLIWPILPFVIELAVIFYCASIALYLASSGIQLYKIVDTNPNETLPITITTIPITTTISIENITTTVSDSTLTSTLIVLNRDLIYYEGNKALNLRSTDRERAVGDYCIPDEFNEWKLKMIVNNSKYYYWECYFFQHGFDTTPPPGVDSTKIANYYVKIIEIINRYQWLPQLFVAFMFFWLTAFVVGLNQMVLAGSFGEWYWTRFENVDSEYKNKMSWFTVAGSFGRAIFYHLGTIAFGSLLIAIVKMIRLILEYLSHKFKGEIERSAVARFCMSCLKCCFWCLEKLLKFLNRYAFIITAVYSYNFCKAAKTAISLITSNVLRVAVVNNIANFILFLSNLAITALISLFAFYFFTKRIPLDWLISQSPDLNYYFLPLIVIIIGVFAISKLFFEVFSIGVDSILICVLVDYKENDGSKEKPYFMSRSFRELLGASNR